MSQTDVSRRRMLKWTGALAAAGVVGIGLGFGADLLVRPNATKTTTTTAPAQTVTAPGTTVTAPGTTATQTVTGPGTTATQTATGPGTTATQTTTTTVTAPPTTISYVPPLSSTVQATVNSIVQNLTNVHTGEETTYSIATEWPPGGSISTGRVVKVHTKNNVVTSMETDDTINAGVAVEDAAIPFQSVLNDQIQHRPVARDLAIQGHLYNPNRLLYPMQRVTGQRGSMNGSFVRVTWETALTTIANMMTATQSKYGNYSIYSNPLGGWQGCNANGWGSDSSAAHQFSEKFTFGVGYGASAASEGTAEITAIYDAKLIVLWGWNASITAANGVYNAQDGYHIRLAREKGIPVIAIDPILTDSIRALADQWIPIRVSTDTALGLAIAYVLFTQNLYDTAFVSKFVEPTGFQQFQNYVLGTLAGPDGAIARTPAWAAPITGIPEATITALAQLIANSKPTYLVLGEAPCSKQPRGENAARIAEYINAMCGNIGMPGTSSSDGGWPVSPVFPITIPAINIGTSAATFSLPTAPYNAGMFQNWKFPDAVLLLQQVNAGTLSVQDYYNAIGYMPGQPMPNIHMGFDSGSASPGNQRPQINKSYQAISTLDYWVAIVSNASDPVGRVADVMLPVACWPENEPTFVNVANGFFYMPRVVPPAGQAKSTTWIYLQLANILGLGSKYSSALTSIPFDDSNPDPTWDTAFENLAETAYNTWAASSLVAPLNPPTWANFLKQGYYMYPIAPLTPHTASVAFSAQIQGGTPFPNDTNSNNHVSGKIEFWSNWLATTNMTQTYYGGTIQPTAMWQPVWTNYWTEAEYQQYPLLVTTAHSLHRMHNWTDANSYIADVGISETNSAGSGALYQNTIYMSPIDAQNRGIVDGDKVLVYNSSGQSILTAMIKASLTPGVVHLPDGKWGNFNPEGFDVRGNPNNLTYEDRQNPSGSFPHMTICQIEKYLEVA